MIRFLVVLYGKMLCHKISCELFKKLIYTAILMSTARFVSTRGQSCSSALEPGLSYFDDFSISPEITGQ